MHTPPLSLSDTCSADSGGDHRTIQLAIPADETSSPAANGSKMVSPDIERKMIRLKFRTLTPRVAPSAGSLSSLPGGAEEHGSSQEAERVFSRSQEERLERQGARVEALEMLVDKQKDEHRQQSEELRKHDEELRKLKELLGRQGQELARLAALVSAASSTAGNSDAKPLTLNTSLKRCETSLKDMN